MLPAKELFLISKACLILNHYYKVARESAPDLPKGFFNVLSTPLNYDPRDEDGSLSISFKFDLVDDIESDIIFQLNPAERYSFAISVLEVLSLSYIFQQINYKALNEGAASIEEGFLCDVMEGVGDSDFHDKLGDPNANPKGWLLDRFFELLLFRAFPCEYYSQIGGELNFLLSLGVLDYESYGGDHLLYLFEPKNLFTTLCKIGRVLGLNIGFNAYTTTEFRVYPSANEKGLNPTQSTVMGGALSFGSLEEAPFNCSALLTKVDDYSVAPLDYSDVIGLLDLFSNKIIQKISIQKIANDD